MSSELPASAGPATPPVCKTGAQVVVDALLAHGVDTVFGYIGASVLPLFDRLQTAPIRFVVPCHEQGGCHMADAYARASGRTGVVIATSGPGACNLVTGLATAMMDSVPLVAITGQVRTDLIGGDAFQEAPMVGITRPVTKHNYIVKDVKNLARTMHEAFYIASTGRPGPVLIDLPVDLEFAASQSEATPQINLPGYRVRIVGDATQIVRAAEAIDQAQRPVLLAGGGVISGNATGELRDLARKANLPVAMTLMGLGSYDQTLPQSLDMLGMHGTAYANYAVQECDLLIAVGTRFDDRVTGNPRRFAPKAQVIHIDIDPASISKLVRADIPIVGDARTVLSELARHVRHYARAAWFAQIAAWKNAWAPDFDRAASSIKPQYVIEELCRRTDGEAVITTGVGQHQMWAAQFYRFRRGRQLITSGGLGTMGFGLPAAIGAQLARPEATVIDIDGDHSFNMTLSELSTAVQTRLPIKICIFNNGYMGMIRQWQELFYDRRYIHSRVSNPDYAAYARAVGATGITVDAKTDVDAAIDRMLAEKKPCVVDFHVEAHENVWPMVPAGKGLHEMEGLLSPVGAM
ncbi:MAG TPA: biosynthetic-type acetolactate synthase large subunit [Sedimentisphaerales bacterium]|nr:biosynthetic-type acetolactate synthase large subunit [Sedimentisphaerales bacterium]HRS10586.1 biosynthetic-type acetolactate synthase large subunit [Sedimentisphaerales bacterium]HRV47190.1 biosynthetic-type acetolactate synthase large subunit [Sedimentisphaerales bacterium]